MLQKSDTPVEKPLIKVLLVEDHTLTRMGLKTALKRTTDISVVSEAANGEEALTVASTSKPDVILMDVGMPVMDGIQATQKILSKDPSARIVMLTQHDNDQDILASLAAGATGYCLKDIEPEMLYLAIRSVHSGDSWLDASIAGRVLKHHAKQQPQAADTESVQVAATNLPEPASKSSQESLSAGELEVLKLIVAGLSQQQIADRLRISLTTAKTHVRNILNKLSVDDRTQAAVHAMRRGLL